MKMEMFIGAVAATIVLSGCPSYKYAYDKQLNAIREKECISNQGSVPKRQKGIVFVVKAKGMAIHVKDFQMKKLRWVFDVTGVPATVQELSVLQLFAAEIARGTHQGTKRIVLNKALKEIRRNRIVCYRKSVKIAEYISVLRSAKYPRYARKGTPLEERQNIYVQRVKTIRGANITFLVRGVKVRKLTYMGIRHTFDKAGVPASLLEAIRLDKLVSIIADKAKQFSGKQIDLYPALMQMRKRHLDTRLRRDL